MQTTIKGGTLVQCLDMYIASAKRQSNATNLLPAVKAAVAQELAYVMGVRSAVASSVQADDDLTITDGKPPAAPRK